MAYNIPNFSGSLTLRTSQSQWLGDPNVHVTNPSALTFAQMDYNWWNLYSWSLQLDNAVEQAAYTSLPNTFTQPNTFTVGAVGISSSLNVSGPTTLNGSTTFGGGNTTFNNGFTVTAGAYGVGAFNGNFTGSLKGTADTASYVDIVGDGITVNYVGSQIRLTASLGNTFSASIAGRVTTLETTSSYLFNQFALSSSRYDLMSASFSASIADLYTGSSVYATKVELLATQSAILAGVTASADEVRAGVTASLNDSSSALRADIFILSGSAAATYATKVELNDSSSALQAGVTASINTYSSSFGATMASNIADLYTGSGTYATKAELLATQSALLSGITASVNALQAGVTASLLEYTTTASFHNYTASYDTAVSTSIATAITASANALQAGVTASINYSSSVINTRLDVVTGSTVINSTTSSFLGTASFVNLVGGPGIIVGPGMAFSASVRTVNGVSPINGNVSIQLVQTLTGTSASLSDALTGSYATGSVWIISGDANPALNGDSFVLGSGSLGQAEWLPIATLDTAAADARYLKLDGANGPMQGNVNWGSYSITSLASAGSTLTSATNLGDVLAQTASLSAGVTASINAISTSISNYATLNSASAATNIANLSASYNQDSASFLTRFTDINNWTGSNTSVFAGTASYLNVEGDNIIVAWNGSTLQLTGSSTAGYVTTASFNAFVTSSNAFTASTNLHTASVNVTTGSLNVTTGSLNNYTGSLNQVTGSWTLTSSFHTFTSSLNNFTASVNVTTGSLEVSTGSLNNFTSSLNSVSSSWVLTSSFNTFTASYVADSASFSSSIAESYYSSSIAGNVITFNKNNGTTQTVTVPTTDVSGLATTASLNSFTASINNWTSSAYTGSVDQFTLTSSFHAFTASALIASASFSASIANINNWTGSNTSQFAGTASHAITASYYNEKDTLQTVTTRGNSTTSSALFGTGSSGAPASVTGLYSFAQGLSVQAIGNYSHAEGRETTAKGIGSHAEGRITEAIGDNSHTEGERTTAIGENSHAEGWNTTAVDYASHAEGQLTQALGYASHTEGDSTITTTSGQQAHAEGDRTTADASFSHVEGVLTVTKGTSAHAEGKETLASGLASHAEGYFATASGDYSHAEGYGTIAAGQYQHAEGKWNIQDTNAIWIVGDGTSAGARSNVLAAYTDKLTVSGSIWATGSVYGNTNQLIHVIPGTNVTITSGSTGYTINAAGGGSTDVSTYLSSSWTGSNTSVFAGTASFVNVTGSGVLVNWNGSTLQLTASAAAGTPNLQAVATAGSSASGSFTLSGSIGLGSTSTVTPVVSAILQLDSSTKGVLFPRMTQAQRTAIATPATGLIVYCTDAPEGLFINKSTGWVQII